MASASTRASPPTTCVVFVVLGTVLTVGGCLQADSPACDSQGWTVTATVYTVNRYSGGDAVLRISNDSLFLVTTRYAEDSGGMSEYRGMMAREARCMMDAAPAGHEEWHKDPAAAVSVPVDPVELAALRSEIEEFVPGSKDWGSSCPEVRTRTYQDHPSGKTATFTHCDHYYAGLGSDIMNATHDMLRDHAELWR